MTKRPLATRLLTTALAATALAMPGMALADHHANDGTTMHQHHQAAPLIPRDALFGNPSRAGGQISPDGKWLSWLAPKDGVLNVWMAPVDNPDGGKPMTDAKDRPIRQYDWSPDSQSLLYIQDKGGDENFLLYGVNIASGKETTLTPFEKTRVLLIGGSESIRDKILVGLNNRNPQYHDVHLLNLNTGELT
ncbi:MAG TPA: S9 family peptidase, partial [Erythrobacter sp.]|nr:S9 family peptidase [Erythrobacter sp.]